MSPRFRIKVRWGWATLGTQGFIVLLAKVDVEVVADSVVQISPDEPMNISS